MLPLLGRIRREHNLLHNNYINGNDTFQYSMGSYVLLCCAGARRAGIGSSAPLAYGWQDNGKADRAGEGRRGCGTKIPQPLFVGG